MSPVRVGTIVVSEELRLVPVETEHAEQIFNVIDTNREFLGERLIWVPSIQSVGDVERNIIESILLREQQKCFDFTVFYKDCVAGRVSIRTQSFNFKIGDIGYWIGNPYNGLGIATQVARAVVEYGFSSRDFHRIEVRTAVHNQKSRKIPERLGFTLEATLREALIIQGKFENAFLYSVLASEWNDSTRNH